MGLPDFSALSPQDVADAAEAVLGERVDGTLTQYPSYINRVYGLRTEEGRRVIAKFYRPGRWSEAALREEQAFAAECADAGLPVLTPLGDAEGETLHAVAVETEGDAERIYYFALFPFVGGRGWEPNGDDDWSALGRLVGRLHEIGSRKPASSRMTIGPDTTARPALKRLAGVVHPEAASEFAGIAEATLDRIQPLFQDVPSIRLHGDLHRGNLLSAGPEPLLIDFDDTANGPAMQDLWLFLPGRLADSRGELNLILEGYEEIRPFDHRTVGLIEPLRFMRMLGYLDWQARQRSDAGFDRAFPDWGGRAFWIKELEDLRDQARVIEEADGSTFRA